MQKEIIGLLSFIIVGVCGCQNESETIRLPAPADAFQSGSLAATSISQTTMHDGSYDNILDGASCTSIILPVTVDIDGQQITVSSSDDYKLVERAIDNHGSNDDLTLIFPITVTLSDFKQIVITSDADLAALTKNCIESGSDDDNECVDFVYPVKINVYDTDNQIATVNTLNDDHDLYEFIHDLTEDEFVSLQFPIVMNLASGGSLTINDNESLASQIQNSKNTCDEHDDSNYSDDDIDDSSLRGVLTSGSWIVEYYFLDTDQTSQFSGFVFNFTSSGSALAVNGGANVNGSWATYGDQGELELDLEFDKYNEAFDKIGEDWTVTNLSENRITLHNDSHESDGTSLIFRKQ